MKNILISGLLAIMSLVFFAGSIAHNVDGNKEAATRCVVAGFSCAIIATIATTKFQRSQELCFLNKSYFDKQEDPYTRAELALRQYLLGSPKSKDETKKAIQEGAIKMFPYWAALRFEIADAKSGNFDLLNAATDFSDGVIPEEWKNGRLPDGFNIAISHIGMGFVADGAVTTARDAIALASLPNSWPSVLRNGRLRIHQSNAIKLEVHNLFLGTMAASTGRLGEDDSAELDAPFILEEVKQTRIELLSAGAAAFASPAGGNFLEIRLRGVTARYIN
jgi:hypothetical protein